MFIVNTPITFTGTISKSKYDNTKPTYYYVVTYPNNILGDVTQVIPSPALSATTDGVVTISNFNPSSSGLYKISIYSDTSTAFGSGTLLGEYLFNVVSADTTSSFRV